MKKTKKLLQTLVFLTSIIVAGPSATACGSNLLPPGNDSISKADFSFNADLVSRFIWRGLPLNLNANIQPYASISFKNLTLGAWGSYAFSNNYAEVDLYLAYDIGAFTFAVYDYYNEDETDLSLNNFFQYSDNNDGITPHSLEGQIAFNGTDNFPVLITLATFFYGNDRNPENKNYYSTYLEFGYEHNIGENTLSYFLGGTFAEGCYAEKAAIVNMGFTASRDFRLSEITSLPVSGSLILNPYAKDIFFVFALTF